MAKNKKIEIEPTQKPYDVCLSFAGEDRAYVNRVAGALVKKGVRVFYDEYDQVNLWGKDLYAHLDFVYCEAAHYCVMFVSKYYAKKLWTNHERQSAQARALREKGEYVLPARFDSTVIPGLRSTVGHIDLKKIEPAGLANLIAQKLRPLKLFEFQNRENYVPPLPDKLYKELGAKTASFKNAVSRAIYDFQKALSRMSKAERSLVLQIYCFSCTHDVAEDLHIDIDLLRRISGLSPAKIDAVLRSISSLGFKYERKHPSGEGGQDGYAHLTWHGSSVEAALELEENKTSDNAVAWAAAWLVRQNYCEAHGLANLMRLNFSAISSATTIPDKH